jgi:hypothetical protein
LCTSTQNTKNMASLYWFGPPESKTLRPVVGVDCLRIACDTRVASSALYWPVDEVSSQTPSRLRPGDLNLRYNSCHILSICSCRNPLKSCLVRQVSRSFRIRSSGESFGRSSGGRVGCQLGRLGPLIGRRVFLVGRAHLSGTAVSLVGGDLGVSMSHTK